MLSDRPIRQIDFVYHDFQVCAQIIIMIAILLKFRRSNLHFSCYLVLRSSHGVRLWIKWLEDLQVGVCDFAEFAGSVQRLQCVSSLASVSRQKWWAINLMRMFVSLSTFWISKWLFVNKPACESQAASAKRDTLTRERFEYWIGVVWKKSTTNAIYANQMIWYCPLDSIHCIKSNFKEFNKPKKATSTWVLRIVQLAILKFSLICQNFPTFCDGNFELKFSYWTLSSYSPYRAYWRLSGALFL